MKKIKLLLFIIASGLILSSIISCSDDGGGGGNGYHKPDTPSWVNATRGTYKDRIEVDWTGVPDSEKYIVYKSIDNKNDFKVIAGNVKENFFNDKNITPNRNYYYKVSAANGDQWSEKSRDALGFAHEGKPIPPEIAHVSNDKIGEIKIEWAPTPQTDSYIIQRSERSNGGFEEIINPETTIPEGFTNYTYTDSNTELVRDKSYYYRIISVSIEDGESNPSEPASGIALENIPLIQEGFEINASNNVDGNPLPAYGNKILITWDNIDLAKTYSIYRAETENGEYIKISGGLVPDSAGDCFYEDTTAIQDTIYFYKITGVSSGGESEKSISAAGLMDSTAAPQVTAPVNVVATKGEFERIKISWDLVDGATKYHVYRSTEINGTYELITIIDGISDNNFIDVAPVLTSDLNNFKNFFYRVTASNGTESRPSVPVQGYAKPLIPEVPQTISTTTGRTDAKIILSFSLCEKSSRYNIYRSESVDGPFNKIAPSPGTGTVVYEENHPAIEVGKTYFYKFSSSNVSGESELSDLVEKNTALQIPEKPTVEKPGKNQRKVIWNPVPHATKYTVEHKAKDSGSWKEYEVTTTERLFIELAGWSTNHYWRVRAVNNYTESERSGEVKITIYGLDL